MLSERKKEQIRQLFEQGENISDISRAVNADRKTVRTHLDQYIMKPQNPQLGTQNSPDQLENSPDTQDIQQKTVQQESIEVPKEIFEKARDLVEEKKKKEIIDEFMNTGVQDQFNNGWWLTKEDHDSEIRDLNEKYKLKMSQLRVSYQERIRELEDGLWNLEEQMKDLKGFNSKICNDNRILDEYIRVHITQREKELDEQEEELTKQETELSKQNAKQKQDQDDREEQIEAKIQKDEQILQKNKQILDENNRKAIQYKLELQKIEEGLQKIKDGQEYLRREREDLNMTAEELLEIRANATERKMNNRQIELDQLSK